MRAVAAFAFAVMVRATAADVAEQLEPIRARHGLPALAAASFAADVIVDAGVCGIRRVDGSERVTLEDKWHLGSCTKSMTSSLAAVLVGRGVLKWETTVAEVFPGMEMDAAWRAVTLEQLLSHRAGAPHDPPPDLWLVAQMQAGKPMEQRMAFVRGLLRTPPDPLPGKQFVYSNQGYSIAGAMLEKAAGKPWEELMQENIFRPLRLDSAGFGAPGSAQDVDHPWGHLRAGSRLGPVTPGPFADNPPAIGPGGSVHMTIRDFARYAGWHAGEGRRRGGPLGADSFKRLHSAPVGGDYALGWGFTDRKWAGGRVLVHNGSNTMNFAVMWVAPERDFAVVAATNSPGERAEKGCDEAVAMLIRRWEEGRR
jgi:CubicO group peptidase (beta-lactamase class C family)